MTAPATPSVGKRDLLDEIRALLRAQLPAAQREMYDLGYLDPSSPGFALSAVSLLLLQGRAAQDSAAPYLTFYAQPVEPSGGALDLARIHEWLEPNSHRYEPLPGQLFVPSGSRRGVADGVLARSHSDAGLYARFLVVRRSGTVELGPASVWQWPQGAEKPWIVDSRKLVAQFAQFLRFLIHFATDFKRPRDWRLFINIRNAQGATLGDFAQGWAPPFDFRGEMTFCIDPHLQLEVAFGGSEAEIEERVREAATRLELAFGFWKPRVYNQQTGELEVAGVTY